MELLMAKIRQELQKSADSVEEVQMEKYMRNIFTYFGVPQPKRMLIYRGFLNGRNCPFNFDVARALYEEKEREFEYLAIDYLTANLKHLGSQHLDGLLRLIVSKSHWDTVDRIAASLIGHVCLRDTPSAERVALLCVDDNIWLRRTSILFMLKWRQETCEDRLEKILKANFGSSEFFINKAIGWALREYSKTNPEFVRRFVEDNRESMSALSIQQASKRL